MSIREALVRLLDVESSDPSFSDARAALAARQWATRLVIGIAMFFVLLALVR